MKLLSILGMTFKISGIKLGTLATKVVTVDKKMVCSMVFTDDVPIEDRVTALRVALRMSNGNDTEEQKGGTTTP